MKKLIFFFSVLDEAGNVYAEHHYTQEEGMEIALSLIKGRSLDEVDALERPEKTEESSAPAGSPKNKPVGKAAKKAAPTQKASRNSKTGRPCCGALGFRHKKGCPEAGGTSVANVKAPLPKPAPRFDDGNDTGMSPAVMTEETFDELKHLQRIGDLSTRSFADQHDVALSEVNRALKYDDHGEYMAS